MESRGTSAYVAEFIGTLLLVFFIASILSVGTGLGFSDWAVIGLVHAIVLAMLVYTLGGTSGAHFNPAVTAALAAARKIAPSDAAVYVVVQLAGGVAGAFLCKLILLDEGGPGNYGASTISNAFLQGKALPGLLVEGIGTFVLMWAIMGTAVNPRGQREWAGLVIGLTLGLVVMTFGPLTGSSLNPARSLGPALAGGEWSDFWVYVVGPVVGAVLAAVSYTAIVIAPQGSAGNRPVDELP